MNHISRITKSSESAEEKIVQHGLRTPDGTYHWGVFKFQNIAYDVSDRSSRGSLASKMRAAAKDLGLNPEEFLRQYWLAEREVVVSYAAPELTDTLLA